MISDTPCPLIEQIHQNQNELRRLNKQHIDSITVHQGDTSLSYFAQLPPERSLHLMKMDLRIICIIRNVTVVITHSVNTITDNF